MIGARAGDMIGSPYERYPTKSKDIGAMVSSFTDDTVLTIAVADLFLNDTDCADTIKRYCAEISQPSIRRDIPAVVQLPGKRTVLQFWQWLGHAGFPRGVCLQ